MTEFQWQAVDEKEDSLGKGSVMADNEEDACEKILVLLELLGPHYRTADKEITLRIRQKDSQRISDCSSSNCLQK